MRSDRKDMRALLKDKRLEDRVVVRIALAHAECRGIRLTADEVDALFGRDDALHTRVDNEVNRLLHD
jgi:hypothetical protein